MGCRRVGVVASVAFVLQVAGGGAIAPASLAEEKVASTSELTVQAAEVLPFVMAQDSSGASEELEAAISEGNRLFNEGSLESQKEAIFQFEKAIKLSEAANQKDKQAYSLVKLAQLNTVLNNKQNALNLYDQSLLVYRALGDVTRESITLNSIGAIYDALGKKEKALDYYNQSLLLSRAESDYSREAATLNNIGAVYKDQGNYVEALSFYQQSLILNRRLKNLLHQIDNLNNIGEIYGFQGKYSQALSNYLNALKIFENSESILEGGLGVMIRQRSTLLSVDHFTKEFKKASLLHNIAILFDEIGQPHSSISYYEKALSIRKRIKDKLGESATLNNLGIVYESNAQYDVSLRMYSESLKIRQDTNDSYGEAITLNNIGLLLRKTGNISQGIEKLQSSLAIFRRIGDPVNEGNTLDSLGSLYKDKGSFLEAERAYQQALILLRDSGSYPIERVVLQNLGVLFEDKRSLDLAISFYKQSINLTEDIRKDLRSLPLDAQSSYTRKVSDTYRRLADLLIKKGRIGEAQQVLELLKIQEINDITEGTRSATPTAQIALSQLEQDIITQYNSLIDFGQKLADCEQTRCDKLGEYQTQYIALTKAYDRFLEDTKTNLTAARATEIDAGTKTFLANADRIVTAQPNTALIYPLVLEDKVRILWATKGGALNQAECPLGEAELSGLVETFRTALQTTSTATPVQQAGKKLYDCLIPPKLQAVLNNSRIDNLIFVPDRITNYIPMAALHDGQSYLIERYSLSNILAASFTDTDSRLPSEPSILGFGLSQAVTLDNPTRTYSALPFVPQELDAIVKRNSSDDQRGIFPGQELLDQDFTQANLTTALLDKPNILHIATHGAFVPTDPRSSYLVLGDGTSMPISDVQYLRNLSNIHLVVLSACETALGGRDRNGLEIAGISSYFLGDPSKAKAVLASLWKVNDPATSLLMADFYQQLNQTDPEGRKPTKAQAMQAVQLEFIRSQQTLEDVGKRAGIRVVGEPQNRPQSLSHPYYWAPFVLIGNSL